MRRCLPIISLVVLCVSSICVCLSACDTTDSNIKPRQEVSSYEEKIEEVELPLQLELGCDYAEIEVYRWEKKQVKFEVTRRIRGNEKKEQLEMKLKKLDVEVLKTGKKISLKGKCRLRAADYPDCCIIIRIYIPKRVSVIECNLLKGRMKFLDNLKCNVTINAKAADTEINYLKGRITYKVDEGYVRISSGELEKDSKILVGKGNIEVTASCKEGGDYVLDTGSGMIRLKVPISIEAAFEYYGADEKCNSIEYNNPARFKLRTGMGDIKIIRT